MRLGVILVIFGLLPTTVWAQQTSVLDPAGDTLRVRALLGGCPVSVIRPASVDPTCEGTARLGPVARNHEVRKTAIALYDPVWGASWNAARPFGRNDGAVWQGKGGNTSLTVGAFVRWNVISVAIRPELHASQNSRFVLSPRTPPGNMSAFAYPLYNGSMYLDQPQRFGAGAQTRFGWGESYVRLDAGAFGAGLSHQAMWWGPGIRNAILMSSNAGGFPHVFLEAARPVHVGIGLIQGKIIWGRLDESGYFDEDDSNDRRFITGFVAAFRPRIVQGLEVGLARTFVSVWRGSLRARDIFAATDFFFKDDSRLHAEGQAQDAFDQHVSVFGRWVFSESDFEMYGEWARGDHASDLTDLLLEPEHGHGFTIGLQKALRLSPNRLLRAFGEITNLKAPKTVLVRGGETATFFYMHNTAIQGYTHRGQVLGAGIGPGADSQALGVDLYETWGSVGVLIERVQHNADLYQIVADHRYGHMVELNLGVHGTLFYGGFEIGGDVTVNRLLNEYYIPGNDLTNLHLALLLRKRLGLR